MLKRVLLLGWVIAIACVNADDLSDFSNDLATDFGPLLVLFGESMTRQYLSESTRFLDYFIFAMAPIGIITAIISVIRVSGHPSLRAFIGRSQEGDGAIEAELCTSTSRDVCELFNKSGITRVLGRPNILELIYIPPITGTTIPRSTSSADRTGLFRIRDYFEKQNDPDTSGWTKVPPSKLTNEDDQKVSTTPFALRPNLSLNVGIKKQPDWVFFSVAVLGFVLQVGVLGLAGAGVWTLGWNLSGARTSAARDYAPVMFIVGTVVMCAGMWSCAALIGQTTHEVRYKRQASSSTPNSRLLWLQPGRQVIGDQNFDSFAYLDSENDPLLCWTSSKKDFERKFEAYTFLAVTAVLVGYITQFIGLRGMKAWVSIAQLGITVVMSVLRGFLRMQRLGKNDNKLAEMPDLVVGHELDWLAFEMVQQNSQNASFWCITGQYGDATECTGQNTISTSASPSQAGNSAQIESDGRSLACNTQPSTLSGKRQGGHVDLLSIRVRLSHLTSHNSFDSIRKSGNHEWADDQIKVRAKARHLSAAIFDASQKLFQRTRPQGDITLRVKASTSVELEKTQDNMAEVILKPPRESMQTRWSIDTAQLEAILGLWLWSLYSDERHEIKDESGNKISMAEQVKTARIISAGIDGLDRCKEANRQGEMSLWLGTNVVMLSEATINIDKYEGHGLLDLWESAATGDDWKRVSEKQQWDQTKAHRLPSETRRFCGWNVVHRSTQHWASGSSNQDAAQRSKLRLQYSSTDGPLLEICAQELFTALIMSLTALLSIGAVDVVEVDGHVRLDNPTVTVLATAFTDSGLGSYSDAISCIVPAFADRLRPDPETVLSALIRAADTYRREAEWGRAEIMMRWACQHHFLPFSEEQEPTSSHNGGVLNAKVLRATGELYRWSLTQHSNNERVRFGLAGLDWMNCTYSRYLQTPELREIISSYQEIAKRFAKPSSSPVDHDRPVRHQKLAEAIRARDRTEALYILCFITAEDLGSEQLQSALPLSVRNDWSEVVNVLLDMNANASSQDEDGRTATSHCAELGYEAYLECFIDLRVFLDLPDKNQKTPFLWAVQAGHANVAKRLLGTGQVDPDRADCEGHTPLSWAVYHGHETLVEMLLFANGVDLDRRDVRGQTVLFQAVKETQEAIVQVLLDSGKFDVNAKDDPGNGLTALHWASRNGNETIVQLLLNTQTINVNEKDGFNQTALHWASRNGNETIVQLLLNTQTINVNEKDGFNQTALHWAAREGNESVFQMLLDDGRTKISKEDSWRFLFDPRDWAKPMNEGIIRRLLNSGRLDPDVEDEIGRAALFKAAVDGHQAIVQMVLDSGKIEINGERRVGEHALIAAAKIGNMAIVKMLLGKIQRGEGVSEGQVALLEAIENGHEEIVQVLLDTDKLHLSLEDETLKLALDKGNGAIVQMLECRMGQHK